jgi:membrane protein YqaA with SNARE-associated domain
MLRSFYHRVITLAGSPRAPLWLAVVAFAESSFFPIPPDALLIPMALTHPRRAWRFALICTVSSVAGGMLGYLIGATLYDAVAAPILRLYHYEDAYARFRDTFAAYGLEIILLKGLTPIPYKIITIAAGAAKFDFPTFLLASIVTRGARFFLVATLLHVLGDPVRHFIETRLTLVTTVLAVSIVGGFLLLKFL